MDPAVSIVMGTYNPRITYLNTAVDSLINQTFVDWELILVDDGSDKNISSEIRNICKRDTRIHYFRRNKNLGLAHALNDGIQKSRGKYVARMDDDDISAPERLQDQMDFLELHQEYGWIGCEADLIDETGIWGKASRPEKPSVYSFLHSSPFIHPSVMFRRDVLTECGGYSEKYFTTRCEDYELFMRLYASGYRGYNLRKNLFQYREDSRRLRRSMKYCCFEMIIRIQGFARLGILSLWTIPYVFKPVMVGIASLFPEFSQGIRVKRSTGDHRLDTKK